MSEKLRGKEIVGEIDFLKGQGENRDRVLGFLTEADVKPDSLKRLLARHDRKDLHEFLFTPEPVDREIPEHGDRSRYLQGCRCDLCRVANTEGHARFRQSAAAQEKDPSDPRHGTYSFYTNHRCRCPKCKEAHSARVAHDHQRRVSRSISPTDPRHGTKSFYSGHGCRCDRCKEASRSYWDQRKKRQAA